MIAVEYVNVPVPEEHVDAVQRFIPWSGMKRPEDVDPATVDRMLDLVDDTARSLLVALAEEQEEREDGLTLTAAAEKVGITPREVIGAVAEVNDVSQRIGGTAMTVFIQGTGGDIDDEADVAIGDRKIVRIQGWVSDRVLRTLDVSRPA